MKALPEQMIADAFVLSQARGADLLVHLGAFNVWRGDLATMRGDNPRAAEATTQTEAVAAPNHALAETLLLARAIEVLPGICRAALSAVYADRKKPASLAVDLDTEPADAQRIVSNCEQRLFDIYQSLANRTPADAATVPEWMSEREHAAGGSNRRR